MDHTQFTENDRLINNYEGALKAIIDREELLDGVMPDTETEEELIDTIKDICSIARKTFESGKYPDKANSTLCSPSKVLDTPINIRGYE